MAVFTNQAQLSYNNTVINSNVAVGEIFNGFTAAKTAVGDTYGRNDEVTYAISIANSTQTAMTGVTVTDNLGGYAVGETTVYPLSYVDGTVRLFINGELAASPTVVAGPPLVFSNITIPAGSNAIIIYEASVTEFAPLDVDDTIVNTATITMGTTTVDVTETVTTEQQADLTITKTIEPTTIYQNDTVTYTFTILNFGNTAATAADTALLTDTFDPILTGITVTFNGTAWTAPTNYTYDETTGIFSTVAGQITVPAATYSVDPVTNAVVITPGVSELVVTGTV